MLAFLIGEHHELSKLLGVLADVTGDRRVRELAGELRDGLKMLSDAYVAARYRVEFPYDSEEDAERFIEVAERVLSTLEEILREHGFKVLPRPRPRVPRVPSPASSFERASAHEGPSPRLRGIGETIRPRPPSRPEVTRSSGYACLPFFNRTPARSPGRTPRPMIPPRGREGRARRRPARVLYHRARWAIRGRVPWVRPRVGDC